MKDEKNGGKKVLRKWPVAFVSGQMQAATSRSVLQTQHTMFGHVLVSCLNGAALVARQRSFLQTDETHYI